MKKWCVGTTLFSHEGIINYNTFFAESDLSKNPSNHAYDRLVAICEVPPDQVPEGVLNLARRWEIGSTMRQKGDIQSHVNDQISNQVFFFSPHSLSIFSLIISSLFTNFLNTIKSSPIHRTRPGGNQWPSLSNWCLWEW